tara:strand:+ start:178 stop:1620 length:1443 start_codon:yes stop_codon:yes gene_type:complete
MAVRGTVNPDGTITRTNDDLVGALNLTNSSLQMPETKDAIYGAFGDVLNQSAYEQTVDDDELFKYGVYQLATQKPELEEGELQRLYGTGAMPIFEWVKTIQSGERTYDPNDFEDRAKLDAYKNLGELPDGFLTPEQIQEQLISDTATAVSSALGAKVGSALAEGVDNPISTGLKSAFGFGTGLPSDNVPNVFDLGDGYDYMTSAKGKNILFNSALANKDSALSTGNMDLYNKLNESRVKISGKGEDAIFGYKSDGSGNSIAGDANIKGTNPTTGESFQTYSADTIPEQQGYWDRVKSDATSSSTYGASAGAGVGAFFTDLILTKGKDPMSSAKKGAGTAVGTYVGLALGGPIGAVVGGTVGAYVGGRVICNELRRHGLMTTDDILIDYYFTQKYLTPTHVNGYHIWAISVVRKMRSKKSVKLWHHIAKHRLNEVKYILGKRDKPDYLGKVYRVVGESICYVLGKFCKKTDWSVLYNKKEI